MVILTLFPVTIWIFARFGSEKFGSCVFLEISLDELLSALFSTLAQLQENVLANPEKYDEKTVKQANLRKTLVGLKKKKKAKE